MDRHFWGLNVQFSETMNTTVTPDLGTFEIRDSLNQHWFSDFHGWLGQTLEVRGGWTQPPIIVEAWFVGDDLGLRDLQGSLVPAHHDDGIVQCPVLVARPNKAKYEALYPSPTPHLNP